MLTGEAKKQYQREYMRGYMREIRGSKLLRPVKMLRPVKTLPANVKTADAGNVRPEHVRPITIADLRAETDRIMQGNATKQPIVDDLPPFYDRNKHKAGDTVRIKQGGGWIIQTVPNLDADGNIINDL